MADFIDNIPQYFASIINLRDLNDHSYNERYNDLKIEGIYITTCYYQKLAAFSAILVLYPIFYLGSLIKNKYINTPFKVLH